MVEGEDLLDGYLPTTWFVESGSDGAIGSFTNCMQYLVVITLRMRTESVPRSMNVYEPVLCSPISNLGRGLGALREDIINTRIQPVRYIKQKRRR